MKADYAQAAEQLTNAKVYIITGGVLCGGVFPCYHSGEACPSDSRCNCGDGTGSEVSGAILLEARNLDLISF